MLAGVSTERRGIRTIICMEEIKPHSFVIIKPLKEIIITKNIYKIIFESMLLLLNKSIPFYSMIAKESAYLEALD